MFWERQFNLVMEIVYVLGLPIQLGDVVILIDTGF
jgi:hypothetical protein